MIPFYIHSFILLVYLRIKSILKTQNKIVVNTVVVTLLSQKQNRLHMTLTNSNSQIKKSSSIKLK